MSVAPGVTAAAGAPPLPFPVGEASRELLEAALAELEERTGFDLDEALTRADAVEAAALLRGDADLVWRARLVQADVGERQGRLAAGVRVMWQVNAYARAENDRRLLSRSHWLLSWAYRDIGDRASYVEHAISAVDTLDAEAPPALRSRFLTRLGDALFDAGSITDARERYLQAEALAIEAHDVLRRLACLNNLAYAEYCAGELGRAQEAIERLARVSEAAGTEVSASTLDTMSRIEVGLGRYDEAVRTARRCLVVYESSGFEEADAVPEYLLTLALAQRHAGDLDGAQASLETSRVLCDERGLASVRVRVLQEQAELHAASGHFAEAFGCHKCFYDAERELVSEQRDAQARLRQSMFETVEARHDAERFRDQAREDSLTSLHNRRFINERLPVLLTSPVPDGCPVAAALIDLDHFKRINDTCSHPVGDEVLVVIGGLLRAAVPTEGSPEGNGAGGFAARMGGEEFLLVLTGLPPHAVLTRLGDLRRTIAEHDWRAVTGAAVPVTVSIGVAFAGSDTQSTLLRRADAALYAAKDGGRDRVVGHPGPEPAPDASAPDVSR